MQTILMFTTLPGDLDPKLSNAPQHLAATRPVARGPGQEPTPHGGAVGEGGDGVTASRNGGRKWGIVKR